MSTASPASKVDRIKPNMPVVCSENKEFGVVDRVEGSKRIRLSRDEEGNLHYIPTQWVRFVDDRVHIDRPGKQAMREWESVPESVSKEVQDEGERDGTDISCES